MQPKLYSRGQCQSKVQQYQNLKDSGVMQATLQYRKGGSHSVGRGKILNQLDKWKGRAAAFENRSVVPGSRDQVELYSREAEWGMLSTLAHGVTQLVSGLVMLGMAMVCALIVLCWLPKIIDALDRYSSPFLAGIQLMLVSMMVMGCLLVLKLIKRLFFDDVPTSVRHYVHHYPVTT